jgi:hypothetical protein
MRGNCVEREVVENNPGKVTEDHNENDRKEDDDEPLQTFVTKRYCLTCINIPTCLLT